MTDGMNFQRNLVGVFGQPVAENPSEIMVEAAFRHHALPWRYLTIEVAPEGLGDAVQGARAMGFAGFNCTTPHKVAVIEHLDGLGESAALMGAVNCVVRRNNRLIGENTDGKGFLSSLRPVIDPAGRDIVIFGAGGAARAIAVELALAGARGLAIVNRGRERGVQLVRLLNTSVADAVGGLLQADFHPWPETYAVPAATDIVVNATSIGLFPNVEEELAIDYDTLSRDMVVADVIPNPPQTRLLREADGRGCRTIDGLGMLVDQGRIGIEHWTGVSPDADVMRSALAGLADH